MIQDYERFGEASGVTIWCEATCSVVPFHILPCGKKLTKAKDGEKGRKMEQQIPGSGHRSQFPGLLVKWGNVRYNDIYAIIARTGGEAGPASILSAEICQYADL